MRVITYGAAGKIPNLYSTIPAQQATRCLLLWASHSASAPTSHEATGPTPLKPQTGTPSPYQDNITRGNYHQLTCILTHPESGRPGMNCKQFKTRGASGAANLGHMGNEEVLHHPDAPPSSELNLAVNYSIRVMAPRYPPHAGLRFGQRRRASALTQEAC